MRLSLLALLLLPLALRASPDPVPYGRGAVMQFTQRLGERLPMQAPFLDEAGRPTNLARALGGRPAVLLFGYFTCPQLCSVVARGMVDSLREIGPSVGPDYAFVYLSIDPADGPAEARQERDAAVRAYGRRDGPAGWHYLTGNAASLRAAAEAAGFAFRYDAASRQFVHPAGFVVATPDGRISRYFFGVDFRPREVAEALRRAGRGEVGTPALELILQCFRGDGFRGRYAGPIAVVLWTSVLATVVLLFGGIGWMLHEERTAARRRSP